MSSPCWDRNGSPRVIVLSTERAYMPLHVYRVIDLKATSNLGVFFFNENNSDHHDVDEIADGRVEVERGHHVHNRQEIGLHVAILVKSHHRCVSDDESLDMTRRTDRSFGTVPSFRLMMFPSPTALNLDEAWLSLPFEPRLCQSTRFCRIFHVLSRSI